MKLQRAGQRCKLVSRCKADPASAGPGSSNMEEQGEGGGEGGRGHRMQSATLLTLSKVVLKGCSVVIVGLLGHWWRRGGAE